MGIHEKLANMFIDNDKNYWFVTESGHFYLYDIKKKILCPIGSERENRVRHYGVPVELAQYKNQCWIVYSSGLIRCWDYSAGEFISEESRLDWSMVSQTEFILSRIFTAICGSCIITECFIITE